MGFIIQSNDKPHKTSFDTSHNEYFYNSEKEAGSISLKT